MCSSLREFSFAICTPITQFWIVIAKSNFASYSDWAPGEQTNAQCGQQHRVIDITTSASNWLTNLHYLLICALCEASAACGTEAPIMGARRASSVCNCVCRVSECGSWRAARLSSAPRSLLRQAATGGAQSLLNLNCRQLWRNTRHSRAGSRDRHSRSSPFCTAYPLSLIHSDCSCVGPLDVLHTLYNTSTYCKMYTVYVWPVYNVVDTRTGGCMCAQNPQLWWRSRRWARSRRRCAARTAARTSPRRSRTWTACSRGSVSSSSYLCTSAAAASRPYLYTLVQLQRY